MAGLAPSPNVVHQEIEGETVILDLARGAYYSLDSVGSRIWQLLVSHGDAEAVVTGMLHEFDVEEAVLRQDISELLERLTAKGLIVPKRRP